MPIEEFGLAMLRGMGWQEGMGVGRNRKKADPVEYLRRPERLGLGAQPAAPDPNAGKKKVVKMGECRHTPLLPPRVCRLLFPTPVVSSSISATPSLDFLPDITMKMTLCPPHPQFCLQPLQSRTQHSALPTLPPSPPPPSPPGDKPQVNPKDLVLAPEADGRVRHVRKLDEKLVGS